MNQVRKDWTVKPTKDLNHNESFSADDVVDAYFKGRSDERDRNFELFLEKFEANLEEAAEIGEEFYREINQNYNCSKVMLRLKDIYNFTLLFFIEPDDYFSDGFINMYDRAGEVKKLKNSRATFNIALIFTHDSPDMNDKRLAADGYLMSYAPEKA